MAGQCILALLLSMPPSSTKSSALHRMGIQKMSPRDFPSGPVIRALRFHCRGLQLNGCKCTGCLPS